jgi:integrase/recombinase XerD
MTLLAPTLQAWFTERLMTQRQASPHTIAGYRDTMRLLLSFASKTLGKAPSKLKLDDLDAELITQFLLHLETERGNSARTRNARLAAIHSLYRYAAFRHPEHAAVIERVLAIPTKQFDRALVNYLTTEEARALIAAPDTNTWTGRRDHALLLVAIQTGLRVSELTGLRCQDVRLGTGAHLYCQGKRRKQRVVPLTSQTVKALNRWLTERGGEPSDPLFPSTRGGPLSRDAVEWLINKHTATAAGCPSLKTKRVTAHALRHTNAMTLLQSDISTSVIALWLGHEHEDTTRAISTATSDSNNGRWTAPRRPEPDPAATARPISS